MLKKFKKISKGDTPTFEQLINGGWRFSHNVARCQVWERTAGKTKFILYWISHTGEVMCVKKQTPP